MAMNEDFNVFKEEYLTSKEVDSETLEEDIIKKKPLILIVDDDIHVREALKIILEKKYDLILCANGNEGIEKVTPFVYAVILDIKMEGKNGFETFIEIKKKNLYVPIIFHSAYQDILNPYQIMNDYRPFGYVIKEGDGKELLDTIQSAVNYYSQIIQNSILIKKIEKSEKKYRDLVENSPDIVFSLDENGKILSINKSLTRILNYSTREIAGKNFFDLVYKSNTLNDNIFPEKFQEVKKGKDTVSFNCDLITRLGEPKEMKLKLKYNSQDGIVVIFGTASNIEEDLLYRLCETETQTYKIGNYLTHVDIISQRLSSSAAKYCGFETSMNLKLCIRELLINAMEHGNLEISFEEKSEALGNGDYVKLFIDRQKNPVNMNKKIIVNYTLSSDRIEGTIADEGNGFDYDKMFGISPNDIALTKLGHGRGIFIARDFFDKIEYNEKGNSVRFVKKF